LRRSNAGYRKTKGHCHKQDSQPGQPSVHNRNPVVSISRLALCRHHCATGYLTGRQISARMVHSIQWQTMTSWLCRLSRATKENPGDLFMLRLALITAALYGALAVGLGAFGAHALADQLSQRMHDVWRTAVQFQFYHALALLAVGLALQAGMTGALMTAATLCFMIGTLLFSGSLYLL